MFWCAMQVPGVQAEDRLARGLQGDPLRIAINGMGVAGPTLAWWLRRYGHEPVLFEKAAQLRTGGYVTDFWGSGFDVAEKMGLVPALREAGYLIGALRMVDGRGRTGARMDVDGLRSVLNGRFVSVARGDIAATIYRACGGVEAHFGESIVGLEERDGGVVVGTSSGAESVFDLAIGADGLHSAVRSLVFGPESGFEKRLGYYVAAFSLAGYEPRDELAYICHTVPNRQVARMALRENVTMFLFVFKDELMGGENLGDPRGILREVFGDMGWETAGILARMEEAPEIYFDHVSQICMERWTRGRVGLVGDAGACVSLLAGEGTGLAMTEAYVLAGELRRAGGDFAQAFANYERLLQPVVAAKQRAAMGFAEFFAPSSAWRLRVRDMGIRATALPMMGRFFVRRMMRGEFNLPEYGG